MMVFDIRENQMPMNKRILVYAYNTKNPGWYIDKFYASGPSDHNQPNGRFYMHNISHWAELPESPISL